MNRRAFLKFIGTTLAVAATAPQIEFIAAKFTDAEATAIMANPTVALKTFQELLREYLPVELLREELMKRDYLLSKIDRGDAWQGATFPIPFVKVT